MPKETPEQAAARLAKRLADARNKGALMMVDSHFGRVMFTMFAQRDAISRDDAIAVFERALIEEPAGSVERVQAEEVIRLLRSRTPRR